MAARCWWLRLAGGGDVGADATVALQGREGTPAAADFRGELVAADGVLRSVVRCGDVESGRAVRAAPGHDLDACQAAGGQKAAPAASTSARSRAGPVAGKRGARALRLPRHAGSSEAIRAFGTEAARHWYRALRRRSQRTRLNWERMDRLATRWLPLARIMHPWPSVRFDARTRGRSPVR